MVGEQVSAQKKRGYHSTTHPPRGRVKKILVVEDESAISSLLGEVLKDWDCDVLIATNGREGLDFLKTERVDGIMLDLEMPIMDGCTMLDELRWQGDHTPVIVMSGGVDSNVLRNMVKEGAQGFLQKPFTLQTLHTQFQECFVSAKKIGSFKGARTSRGRILNS